MAAGINFTSGAPEVSAPILLFPTRIVGGGGGEAGRNYDVAADGRFLINMELDTAAVPITLLLNWHPPTTK